MAAPDKFDVRGAFADNHCGSNSFLYNNSVKLPIVSKNKWDRENNAVNGSSLD